MTRIITFVETKNKTLKRGCFHVCWTVGLFYCLFTVAFFEIYGPGACYPIKFVRILHAFWKILSIISAHLTLFSRKGSATVSNAIYNVSVIYCLLSTIDHLLFRKVVQGITRGHWFYKIFVHFEELYQLFIISF